MEIELGNLKYSLFYPDIHLEENLIDELFKIRGVKEVSNGLQNFIIFDISDSQDFSFNHVKESINLIKPILERSKSTYRGNKQC